MYTYHGLDCYVTAGINWWKWFRLLAPDIRFLPFSFANKHWGTSAAPTSPPIVGSMDHPFWTSVGGRLYQNQQARFPLWVFLTVPLWVDVRKPVGLNMTHTKTICKTLTYVSSAPTLYVKFTKHSWCRLQYEVMSRHHNIHIHGNYGAGGLQPVNLLIQSKTEIPTQRSISNSISIYM
jgi:hypothetical protein